MKNRKLPNKNERRRNALAKVSTRQEKAVSWAGTGKDLYRRLIASFLSLVFVLTAVVIGVTLPGKAAEPVVAFDGTYTISNVEMATYPTFANSATNYKYRQGDDQTINGTVSITVANGKVTNVSVSTNPNSFANNRQQRKYLYSTTYNDSRANNAAYYVNGFSVADNLFDTAAVLRTQLTALVGQDATKDAFESAFTGVTNPDQYGYKETAYNALKDEVLNKLKNEAFPPESDIDENLVLHKGIQAEQNGTYTLNLSAYAKGKMHQIVEAPPTDFVLVLDQSGSMARQDMPTSYIPANNGVAKNWTISDFDNDRALYYKDPDKDVYYRVYRQRDNLFNYRAPNTMNVREFTQGGNFDWLSPQGGEIDKPMSFDSQFFYRPSDEGGTDDTFRPLTVTAINGGPSYFGTYYKYRFVYDTPGGGTTYLQVPAHPVYALPLGWDWFDENDTRRYPITQQTYTDINNNFWELAEADQNYPADSLYAYLDYNVLGLRVGSTGMYIDHPLYLRTAGYSSLAYRDENGVEHKLIDATYSDANGRAVGGECTEANGGKPIASDEVARESTQDVYWNGILYEAPGNRSEVRLESLYDALNVFVDEISSETDSYGKVDNRIAIVGFSSPSSAGNYNNTELLTGVNVTSANSPGSNFYSRDGRQHNGPQYGNGTGITNQQYSQALLRTADPTQLATLYQDLDYITAYGGTHPELGFQMAKRVLDNRTITTYTKRSTGEQAERKTVVIFFTDGRPSDYPDISSTTSNWPNQYETSDAVVQAASAIKADGKTKIYSVGVLAESDGNPLLYRQSSYNITGQSSANDCLTKPFTENDYNAFLGDIYTTDPSRGLNGWSATRRYYFRDCAVGLEGYPDVANDTIADYFEVVSSKYPDSTSFADFANSTNETYSSYNERIAAARGTTVDDSQRYYYNATDAAALAEVFRQLAESISESDIEMELTGENSYLQDVVNLDYFDPSSVTVTAKVFDGEIVNGEYTRGAEDAAMGADLVIDTQYLLQTGKIRVSNFDYTGNYIAEGHPGKEIVVYVNGLVPQEGVTGANLPSNDEESAIFKVNEDDPTQPDEELKDFETPAISRHKYTLHVGNVDTDATFDLEYTVGTADPGDTPNGKAVVLRDEDGNGQRMEEDPTLETPDSPDGTVVYAEFIIDKGEDGNVDPADYKLDSNTTYGDEADPDDYTYYYSTTGYVYGNDQVPANELGDDRDSTFPTTQDGDIYITSKENLTTVTIKEAVTGNYSNPTDEFTPTLILVPPTGTTVEDTMTFNGTTWTKDGDNNWLTITVPAIQGDETDSFTVTVPIGWTLKVDQVDEDNYIVESATVTEQGSTPGTPEEYEDGGWEWPITTATDIVILNSRDSIPVTSVQETTKSIATVLYILSGVLAMTAGAIGLYMRKFRKPE